MSCTVAAPLDSDTEKKLDLHQERNGSVEWMIISQVPAVCSVQMCQSDIEEDTSLHQLHTHTQTYTGFYQVARK